jgi:LPXTG-motif cell wall-anchored protein
VLKFGPGVAHTLRIFFGYHFYWLIVAAIAGLAVWFLLRRRKRRAGRKTLSQG